MSIRNHNLQIKTMINKIINTKNKKTKMIISQAEATEKPTAAMSISIAKANKTMRNKKTWFYNMITLSNTQKTKLKIKAYKNMM